NCPTSSALARVICRVFSKDTWERRPQTSLRRGAFSWRNDWSLKPTNLSLRSHSRPDITVFDASMTHSQNHTIAHHPAFGCLPNERRLLSSCGAGHHMFLRVSVEELTRKISRPKC